MNTKLKSCELFRDERLCSDLLNRCVLIGETVKRGTFWSIVLILAMFTVANSVRAQSVSGSINGHDYVDLGLSVKWATCNVGASKPSDYGNYYAWGETSTKSTYTEENSKTYGKKMVDIKGDGRYDVARANWSGSWRIPTREEMQELVDNCTWTWTIQGGHSGYRVTGPNGKSIFFPAAGFRTRNALSYTSEVGYFWTSMPDESNTQGAGCLRFSRLFLGNVGWDYRDSGFSVRPVTE